MVFRLLFRASFLGSHSGSKRREPRKGQVVVNRMLVLSGEVYKMELEPQDIWQPLSLEIYRLDF